LPIKNPDPPNEFPIDKKAHDKDIQKKPLESKQQDSHSPKKQVINDISRNKNDPLTLLKDTKGKVTKQ
jgi:hypothetical protein